MFKGMGIKREPSRSAENRKPKLKLTRYRIVHPTRQFHQLFRFGGAALSLPHS